MKVLMVGCGAVGQVFGLHLQAAGVELGFYARPLTAEKLLQKLHQGGLILYQTSYLRRSNPIIHRLANYQVFSDIPGCQRFQPDQVWFTTPSPVYYTDWFRNFLQEVPSERVVCFAPEGRRFEFIPEGIRQERLVFGGITFISWQGGPEAGGGRAGGVNFWLPPLSTIPLVGAEGACEQVADIFKKTGLRAVVQVEGFQELQGAVTALMSAFVVGYQLSGWSLKSYRRSPWLKAAALSAWEAVRGQLSGAGFFTRALFRILSTTAVFYSVTLILPLLTPFDIQKYLKFHYQKTREQTLTLLETFAGDGKKRNLEVGNIRVLLEQLRDMVP